MFHEIMIDLREYRLRRRRLKWSRLYFVPPSKNSVPFIAVVFISSSLSPLSKNPVPFIAVFFVSSTSLLPLKTLFLSLQSSSFHLLCLIPLKTLFLSFRSSSLHHLFFFKCLPPLRAQTLNS